MPAHDRNRGRTALSSAHPRARTAAKRHLRSPRWATTGGTRLGGKQQQASVICPLSARRTGARLSGRVGGRAPRIPLPHHHCKSVDSLDLTTRPPRHTPTQGRPRARRASKPRASQPGRLSASTHDTTRRQQRTYAARLEAREPSKDRGDRSIHKWVRMGIDGFDILKTLGEGAFASVHKVRMGD